MPRQLLKSVFYANYSLTFISKPLQLRFERSHTLRTNSANAAVNVFDPFSDSARHRAHAFFLRELFEEDVDVVEHLYVIAEESLRGE